MNMNENLKRYLTVSVVVLLVVSIFASFGGYFDFTSEVVSANSDRDVNLDREFDIERDDIPTMYVLVNSTVQEPLDEHLTQYKEDVEETRDLDVKIIENEYSNASEIRSFLKEGYENNNLVGTFFVGNLPYAEFELSNDYGKGRYTRFPIDLYFKDLDGTWRDSNNSGVYDEHLPGEGDLDPEIWLGRLSIQTDWAEEVALYENYFEKVYQYRRGNLSLNDEALLYIDDDWESWTDEYKKGLTTLYNEENIVNDTDTTRAKDYAQRLREGYESVQIMCHANHSPRRHAFRKDGGPKGSGGNFTSRDLYEEGQRSLFQNVFTCGSADYTLENNLCGWYALTEDYGLANVGSTKSGSMLEFENYYEPLANGKSLGEAMRSWWKDTVEDDLMSRSWFYGMTTIGDQTLSPLEGEEYELEVDTQGEGEVKIEPELESYQVGEEVELTAIPEEGWEFAEWTGDIEANYTEDDQITITMDEDKNITANFEEEGSEDTIPPTADAGDNQTVTVDEEFTLNASDSSDNIGIASYQWHLDNGKNETGEQINYTYDKAGNYTVELTVTDEAGNNDTDTVEITVEESDDGDDDGGDDTPGFTSLLLLTATIIAVAIYRKRSKKQ
ncbi:MAG: PKD domain-containing protein [Thermoplasmata archaeon]